jgi:hypothetical protein
MDDLTPALPKLEEVDMTDAPATKKPRRSVDADEGRVQAAAQTFLSTEHMNVPQAMKAHGFSGEYSLCDAVACININLMVCCILPSSRVLIKIIIDGTFHFSLSKHTDEESKDRALQQRVRRMATRLEKGEAALSTDGSVVSVPTTRVEKEFEKHIAIGKRACEFLTQATDPFLAVKTCTEELDAAGFVKLSKREPFGGVLKPGELR